MSSSTPFVIYFDLGNTLVHSGPGGVQVYDDTISTLESLYERGYLIGILSDQSGGTTVESVDTMMTTWGFARYIDVITISSELPGNIHKPDPRIFNLALEKVGYTEATENTVFITETPSHIEAARNLGWRAILKRNEGNCVQTDGECVISLSDLLDLFPHLNIDLYIRDAIDDPGADIYSGSRYWDSPDLWIRNTQDEGEAHQNPEYGSDNWFYAKVTNRGEGIARSFTVTFNVTPWAGTQFVFPQDYVPYIASVSGIDLTPGTSKIVCAKWDSDRVPPNETHPCLLSAVYAFPDVSPAGRHVWEHNNLAQKNLTIVDLQPNDSYVIPFRIGSHHQSTHSLYRIEVRRPKKWEGVSVSLVHSNQRALERVFQSADVVEAIAPAAGQKSVSTIRFLEPSKMAVSLLGSKESEVLVNLSRGSIIEVGSKISRSNLQVSRFLSESKEAEIVKAKRGSSAILFHSGIFKGFPIVLNPQSQFSLGLKIEVPSDANSGDIIEIDLIQRNVHGQVVGGISVRVNVVEKDEARLEK
ncbi:MAG: HAD hydrolase-like protein [Candidatus Thorarchaeota archaeon]|nr:HAD hydrolase-like protein [Candidatus Thorarchaeota archaeon]